MMLRRSAHGRRVISARVMTQNTSQAILVKLRNPADKECQSTIALPRARL